MFFLKSLKSFCHLSVHAPLHCTSVGLWNLKRLWPSQHLSLYHNCLLTYSILNQPERYLRQGAKDPLGIFGIQNGADNYNLWSIYIVPGKQKENKFERRAIYRPLEGMTLSGVCEQTEPQLFLLDIRSYSQSRIALSSSSLGWNK